MAMRCGKALVVLIAAAWVGSAIAGPITDTVTVSSTEWAQVEDFTSLSWNQINSVCPSGVCTAGTLNGFDMAGWTWASVYDVNALFNLFLGNAGVNDANQLGLAPDSYQEQDSTWGAAFLATGFRSYESPPPDITWTVAGMVSDPLFYVSGESRLTIEGIQVGASPGSMDSVGSFFLGDNENTELPFGAWFKRPAAAVPNPSTLSLFGVALIGLLLRPNRAS